MSAHRVAQGAGRYSVPLSKSGSEWSPQEMAELRQLAMRRLKAKTIAGLLGRTTAAVRGKAANCGIDIISDRAPTHIPMRLEAR